VERYGKVAGRPNSKIPSIFDHTILDSSTRESYYHQVVPERAAALPGLGEMHFGIGRYEWREWVG
jgi:hypothetical protein